jgi:hypothetical protein
MLQNGHWRSVAVQAVSKPEICQGVGFILWAGARVRVQDLAGFVMGAEFCKNHDELIDPTVRVSCSCFVKLLGSHFIPFWVMSQISKS